MNPYFILKTIHILFASIFFVSTGIGIGSLLYSKQSHLFMKLTGHVLLPLGFLQLLSGYTLISLQHYAFSHLWVKISVLGFLSLCLIWLALLMAILKENQKLQCFFSLLSLCHLLIMVFFMANRLG